MRQPNREETVYGPGCVIGPHVRMGKGCIIGAGAVIENGTVIGDHVRIDPFAHLGKEILKSRNSAVTKNEELEPLTIGDGALIGTGAVLYRGACIGEEVLIADYATVREHVTVGKGSIIGRGAAVENATEIGRFCKIETNAYITAYSSIKDFCFVGPCAVTSNDNFVGRTEERFQHFKGVVMEEGARIGAGAVLLPGVTLGRDALVGAGSVVLRDVPPRTVVAGNPARVIRQVPDEQLLENQGWQEKK